MMQAPADSSLSSAQRPETRKQLDMTQFKKTT